MARNEQMRYKLYLSPNMSYIYEFRTLVLARNLNYGNSSGIIRNRFIEKCMKMLSYLFFQKLFWVNVMMFDYRR